MIGPDLIQQWSCPWTRLTTAKTVRTQLRSAELRHSFLFFGKQVMRGQELCIQFRLFTGSLCIVVTSVIVILFIFWHDCLKIKERHCVAFGKQIASASVKARQ